MSYSDRHSDEAALKALRLVRAGKSYREAGKAAGYSPDYVRALLGRVMRDDVAMSGEDPAAIKAAYKRAS